MISYSKLLDRFTRNGSSLGPRPPDAALQEASHFGLHRAAGWLAKLVHLAEESPRRSRKGGGVKDPRKFLTGSSKI